MISDLGLELSPREDHVLLHVQAQPRARRNRITGVHDGALRVATTQPPEAGRANEAIRKLLADALCCAARDIVLVRGASSRRKVFRLEHCTATEVEFRLKELL